MQIYLDSAELDLIQKYVSWGIVDGVTTNPTLIAKSGAKLKERIQEICKIVSGPVSCEVLAEDLPGMIEQGRFIKTFAPNVYVKLPCNINGLQACSVLSKEDIKINMTLIFSLTQAILASKAGATLVSPFVGRLEDNGQDGIGLVSDIVKSFRFYNIQTKVLAASLRSVEHIVKCVEAGADIATIPPQLLEPMLHHELTVSGVEKFMKDASSISF